MNILVDKSGKAVAYIYNNVVLLTGSFKVTGVILGHCVFGNRGTVKGRFFDQTLYSPTGEIIAKEKINSPGIIPDIASALNEAWQLVQRIKDHQCPWVAPRKNWSTVSLAEALG